MSSSYVIRQWMVCCPDGIMYEDELSKTDAGLSLDEANSICSCRGKHQIRKMPGAAVDPVANFAQDAVPKAVLH